MKTRVEELLLKISITPNLRGFKYIVDAIILLIDDSKKYASMTKELYPEIALKTMCTFRELRGVLDMLLQGQLTMITGRWRKNWVYHPIK